MGFLDRLLGGKSEGARLTIHADIDKGLRVADGRHEPWYVRAEGDRNRFVPIDGGLPRLHLIPYRDSGGEDVLRLCEDSTGLLIGPTDRRLPAVGVFVSQLRGERYYRAACKKGDFQPGASVRLVREPENAHDRFAVAVHAADGARRAAYVNKQKARLIAGILDGGTPLRAISIRGTRPGQECTQIAILAAAPEVVKHLLEPRPYGSPPPAHLR